MKRGPHTLTEPHDVHASILRSETIDKFGHDPFLLRDSSCKLVVVICRKCGKTRDKQYRIAMQDLCLKCANAERAVKTAPDRSVAMKEFYAGGGRHPMKGRKQSQKAIDAIRKIGQSQIGRRNPAYGKCRHSKGVWYKMVDGNNVFLRSSYEVAYAKYLDANQIGWIYEPTAFEVSYDFNGRTNEGTYRPDFYLPKQDLWIEVKGWWRGDARVKFDAFTKQYPKNTIQVIGEKELKQLGLI